jgi:hypothetical protein
MRVLVTLLAYLLSLVLIAVTAFFAVIFLAGPHGGVLPSSLHTATLVLGWLCVLLIPMLVARWAWRGQSRVKP